MQWLRSMIGSVLTAEYGPHLSRGHQRRLAVVGVLALTMVLVASALIYLVPFGAHIYSADVSESGSIRPGEQVRIAGIVVGSVKSVELHDDSVRLRFTAESGVFVGDRTTLAIRMLMPIGGHYIALSPAGTRPLGAKPIPAERITLPYSLSQAMQDAERPVREVDAATLRRNADALADSLEHSPGSIRTLTGAMATFADMMNRQTRDVDQALAVADEYLALLDDSRSIVGDMLSKIGIMETEVLDKRAEVLEALRVVAELLSRIAAVEPAWREQLEPLASGLLAAAPQLRDLGTRLTGVAENLRGVGERLRAMIGHAAIGVDQSNVVVPAPAICVPVPGKGC